MKAKYHRFARKLNELCEEFKYENFNAREVLEICEEIIADNIEN